MTQEQMERLLLSGQLDQSTYDSFVRQNEQPQLEPVAEPTPPDIIPAQDPMSEIEQPQPVLSQPAPVQPVIQQPAPEPVEPVTPALTPQPVGTVTPDDPLAPFNESIVTQQQSVQDQANIQDMASIQLQKDRDEMADQAAKDAEKLENQRIANAAEAKEEQGKIDGMVDTMSKEKYEGYWASKSTGSKILAGLAVAFGALGQTYGNGGANVALKIINKAADDDFKVHQGQAKQKLQAISQARLSASDKIRLAKDEILGLQARQVANIKVMQFKIDNMATRAGSQVAKEKANQMNAQLDQVMAEKKLQYDAASAALQAKRDAAMSKARTKKPMGGEVIKRYDNITGVLDGVGQMSQIIAENKGKAPARASFIRDDAYEVVRRRVSEDFGRMQSGGAINDEERKSFMAMLPTRFDKPEIATLKLEGLLEQMSQRKKRIDDVYDTGSSSTTATPAVSTPKKKKTVVRRMINRKTGKRIEVYADGTHKELN